MYHNRGAYAVRALRRITAHYGVLAYGLMRGACYYYGKILIPIELAVFIGVIGGMLDMPWTAMFVKFVGILSLPYVIAVAVYANTGDRFKK